jgi:hypothetical protein
MEKEGRTGPESGGMLLAAGGGRWQGKWVGT